jgi:hypothetical protein
MDEVRSLLGEFFFVQGKRDEPGKEEGKMKYPKKYSSLAEFEREELCSCKVSWSIDDFFDDVFLSGDMDMGFDEETSGLEDELDGEID